MQAGQQIGGRGEGSIHQPPGSVFYCLVHPLITTRCEYVGFLQYVDLLMASICGSSTVHNGWNM